VAEPLRYPRILLKLSGVAFAGERGFGFDFDRLTFFALQIEAVVP
jgi:uridylate kinase